MEAIRSVRTALHFARMDAGNNIVMLTGPEPQVGKSFVSVNLAGTLALAGESVIVVDADLRRGHINKAFNLPRDGGLSDVIAGRMALDEAIHTTDLENFSVLTTGTFPPNPSELLLQDRFEETMQALSKRFDHVIIDSPPVLAVTDAAIIGRLAGVVMLVLKSGTHSLRMIDDTVGRLERANIRVQGTLFNQVGRGRLAQYSYKYGYYYGGYKYEYKPSGQNS
jgi:tyrosine-protein kinase Etk/Wzc